MATIDLVIPELHDEAPPAGLHPAPRRGLDTRSRISLIDNGKPRAKELLLLVAERLKEWGAAGQVNVVSKGSASRVIDDAEVADLAANSDAVIAGLGDCGACSACSLADAIRMEGAGVPSTVIISDVFIGHVASFAVAMGMPGYHNAVVPHPVSSKNGEQLQQFADRIAELVLAQLGGTAASSARRVASL